MVLPVSLDKPDHIFACAQAVYLSGLFNRFNARSACFRKMDGLQH